MDNENISRMKSGKLYDPGDEDILKEQLVYLDMLHDYNATRPSETGRRAAMLKEMLGKVGDNCYIEAPFYANWGGHNVYLGKNVYMNFNLILVDDAEIHIGDYVKIGPNVTIATAGHPILPSLREKAIQFNLPVNIGNNVWIGAGSVVLPGVTVGENSVIGAGSVVTSDIPANVVAFGNPCHVHREISERDKMYYYKDCKVDM